MKLKTTVFLAIASALLLGGCSYTTNNFNPRANNAYATPTAQPTPTPTKAQSLNEINSQLNATIDDGGQADLNQLQKDSSGF